MQQRSRAVESPEAAATKMDYPERRAMQNKPKMHETVREFMTLYYKGPKSGQEFRDLWQVACNIDSTLDIAHKAGAPTRQGFAYVEHALQTDDRLEHWLNRISAQISYLRAGKNTALLDALQSGLPPGDDDLAPQWKMETRFRLLHYETILR